MNLINLKTQLMTIRKQQIDPIKSIQHNQSHSTSSESKIKNLLVKQWRNWVSDHFCPYDGYEVVPH
jgi:hypothetical protein